MSLPYALQCDVLVSMLQIAEDDRARAGRRKLEDRIAPLLAADDEDDIARAQPDGSRARSLGRCALRRYDAVMPRLDGLREEVDATDEAGQLRQILRTRANA